MGKQNQRRENSRSHSKHMQNKQKYANKTISKNYSEDQYRKAKPTKGHKNKKEVQGGGKNDRKGDFKAKNNLLKGKNIGPKPAKKKDDIIDPNNPIKSLKKLTGNSAFKIVPEGNQ